MKKILTIMLCLMFISTPAHAHYHVKAKYLSFRAYDGRGLCNGIRAYVGSSLVGGLGFYKTCPWFARGLKTYDFEDRHIENMVVIANELNDFVRSLDPETELVITRWLWNEKDPTAFIQISYF